jgi:hypothetical protein
MARWHNIFHENAGRHTDITISHAKVILQIVEGTREMYVKNIISRKNKVGIATGYGLGDRGVGVRVPVGSRIFSSPRLPDRLWGPPNLLSNEYQGLSLGVKRPGREADHSPPASAEVNKMWIYTSTPPYDFMA